MLWFLVEQILIRKVYSHQKKMDRLELGAVLLLLKNRNT